jgi:hypothetical protein
MITLNYNPQTGKFRYTVCDELDERSIDLLKKIRDADGCWTMDTLIAERDLAYDENDEKKAEDVGSQIQILYDLEDYNFVKKHPIYDKGVFKDFEYRLSYIGKVLLDITEKKI